MERIGAKPRHLRRTENHTSLRSCQPKSDYKEVVVREKTMLLTRFITGIAVVICLNAPAAAEMYTIKNPAEKISNPADKIYNPATKVDNPAGNIYNPASRMNDPDPLSPPTQPLPAAGAALPEAAAAARPEKKGREQSQPRAVIPQKEYNLKTARAYINAAKKAFFRDDYSEFIAISEDAVRRINAGTLKASKKNRQQLIRYKVFGYGLLEKNETQ
jgi:hypothetical protein